MTRTANMLMVFLLCLFLLADVSYCTSDVCRLPKVTGFCRAAFHRFYFNARTRRCEPFIYGGCGGNANNFGDKAHCLESCLGRQHVCQLPKVTGFCRAAFPRFYYNTQTRTCESFIYGGCGGNANNFEDKAQCQEFCLGRRRIVFPEKK